MPSCCATATTIPDRPGACWWLGAGSIVPRRSPTTASFTSPKPCSSRWTTRCVRRSRTCNSSPARRRPLPLPPRKLRVVLAQRPDAEILALWLADAVLTARLKWSRPLPLIAGALVHSSLRSGGHRPYPGDTDWTRSCCVAYGRAAAQACDLFAELGRSSQKLIALAPRLRARGAGAVIETLLNEDAVLPSARRGAMSARGSRRLFDRLVALGGVRELTGRSTFRLYGL
jgi:hypothetical protein